MRRLRRLVCEWLGHADAQAIEGTYQGYFLRASICPRCHFIFAREVGPRRHRRAAWRRRMGTS